MAGLGDMFYNCCCPSAGCTNGTRATWTLSSCRAGWTWDQANVQATVSDPDGNPVSPVTISGATISAPVGKLGTYTLAVSTAKTFAGSGSLTFSTCQAQSQTLTLTPRVYSFAVVGCPNSDASGPRPPQFVNGKVSVTRGQAAGSATIDGQGNATVTIDGPDPGPSSPTKAHFEADRWRPLDVTFTDGTCVNTLTPTEADCWGCVGTSTDPTGYGCPTPPHTSGTVQAPFGQFCSFVDASGKPLPVTFVTSALPYTVANGKDVTCSQQPATGRVDGQVIYKSNTLQIQGPACPSGSNNTPYLPRTGPASGLWVTVVSVRFTQKLSCDPLKLTGTFAAPNNRPDLAWANGTYTYTADGCGCTGPAPTPIDNQPQPTSPTQGQATTQSAAQSSADSGDGQAGTFSAVYDPGPPPTPAPDPDRETLAIWAAVETCPFASGPCGCAGGPPRLCKNPDRRARVYKPDCFACLTGQWDSTPRTPLPAEAA